MINLAVLGLIHHNKSGSTDPLQVIMGEQGVRGCSKTRAHRDL